MKDIMASESWKEVDGVASFSYSPADPSMQLLFRLTQPVAELGGELMRRFAGTELRFEEIYERHSVGTPFVRKHYRQALSDLEEEGLISVRSNIPNRRKGTFSKHVFIAFQQER